MSNITASSRFPAFIIPMNETADGVAISARVQLNINEDVGTPSVVDVKTFRNGVVDVKAAEGFQIIGGSWIIDPQDHYSGQGTPYGYILQQISYEFAVLGETEGVFIMKAGLLSTAPGNPPINQVNGTVNATLKVVYRAV